MNNYLIAEAYKNYKEKVFHYFLIRIDREEDAEDLTQDVFLRLMEKPEFLREDTLRSLVFTVAHNLLMDYIRRHYAWQKVAEHIKSSAVWVTEGADSRAIVRDLGRKEGMAVSKMPELRRDVYRMVRYQGKTAVEVAKSLDKPLKTVTDQLYLGRKAVRNYLKECI